MNPDLNPELSNRADGACELCGAAEQLDAFPVPPHAEATAEHGVVLCATCLGQARGDAELDATHLFCLQGSAWSEVQAVQILTWQLLHRLPGEAWALELREQIWLDDAARAWAEAGLKGAAASEDQVAVVDSNGTPLANGDSVSLIKSLDVKGTSFVAKRGTAVRNIRLTEDPTHVQGKVNGVTIYIKTEYVKKIG
ncbi:MAG: PhnA domain-containing protein [Myxococcales bacterium]|nr:PhnA domain-containing protein [Myxococcales bacterium]